MTYKQTSTTKRVLFFDLIRTLMIALVIAVHVFPLAFTSGWFGIRIHTAVSAHQYSES